MFPSKTETLLFFVVLRGYRTVFLLFVQALESALVWYTLFNSPRDENIHHLKKNKTKTIGIRISSEYLIVVRIV